MKGTRACRIIRSDSVQGHKCATGFRLSRLKIIARGLVSRENCDNFKIIYFQAFQEHFSIFPSHLLLLSGRLYRTLCMASIICGTKGRRNLKRKPYSTAFGLQLNISEMLCDKEKTFLVFQTFSFFKFIQLHIYRRRIIMTASFRLGEDTLTCVHDEDDNICGGGATCAHCRECRVTRCVNKRYLFSAI
jgi:hypothetical protein